MAGLQAAISGDCRLLTITGDSTMSGAQVDLYWNDVSITSVPYDPSTLLPITALDSTGSLVLSIGNFIDSAGAPTTTYTHLNGIFKIVVTVAGGANADTIYEVGTVGMCDINCCLGAKTKELIQCKCGDCSECTNIISDITKIYMLMNGAKINVAGCVQTTVLYEKSIDEYYKAKSICGTKNCLCNC
jgi:hypothetical protein